MRPTVEFVDRSEALPAAPPPDVPTLTYGSFERELSFSFDSDDFCARVVSATRSYPSGAHLRHVSTGGDELIVGGFLSSCGPGSEVRPDEFADMVILPDDPDSNDHVWECGGCGARTQPSVFLRVPVLAPVDGAEPDYDKLVGNPENVADAAADGARQVLARNDARIRGEYHDDIKPGVEQTIVDWWMSGSRGADPTGEHEKRRLMRSFDVWSDARCEHCFPELWLGMWPAWDMPDTPDVLQFNFGYFGSGHPVPIETVRIGLPY